MTRVCSWDSRPKFNSSSALLPSSGISISPPLWPKPWNSRRVRPWSGSSPTRLISSSLAAHRHQIRWRFKKKRPAQPQSQTPTLLKRLRLGSHSESRLRSAPDTSSLGLTALPGSSHTQQRHLHQRRTASGLECRLSALLKKPRRAGATLCPVIAATEERLPQGRSLVVLLDDTLARKTGPKIHGVSWRRDPSARSRSQPTTARQHRSRLQPPMAGRPARRRRDRRSHQARNATEMEEEARDHRTNLTEHRRAAQIRVLERSAASEPLLPLRDQAVPRHEVGEIHTRLIGRGIGLGLGQLRKISRNLLGNTDVRGQTPGTGCKPVLRCSHVLRARCSYLPDCSCFICSCAWRI